MNLIQKLFSSLIIYIILFTRGNGFHEKLIVENEISYSNVKQFYDWYFWTTRTLNVINLIGTDQSNRTSESDINSLLISSNFNKRPIKNFQVLVDKNSIENNYGTVSPNRISQGKTHVTDESNEVLRKYADFNRGFLLVTPSVTLGLTYFQQRIKLRRFFQRDISIVIIADTQCEQKSIQTQIYELLRTAWQHHGLLNIVVQTTCQFSHKFFIFRPLHLYQGFYGTLNWYHLEDILMNLTVTLNTLKTLNNYPMQVNLFYRYPTALEIMEPISSHVSTCYDVLKYSHFIGGVDGCTLGHLAKHMNFTVVIEDIKSQGVKRFGHILPNGSLTGSLGDVVNRKTYIVMNGIFLEYKYAKMNVEFTQVFQSHRICPVVPKSGRIPAWISILRVFTIWSWISIAFVDILVCLLLALFSLKSSADLYYIFFRSQSVNHAKDLKYRIVLATYLFVFHVVLGGIFNGHLFKNFSTISHYPDIDSLKDLASSDLPIETNLDILHDDPKESDLIRQLSRKVLRNYKGSSPAMERAAFLKNIVALERRGEAKFKIYTKYLDDNGVPLLHLVDDCIMTHFISRIVPEGSPFLLVFNIWFSRFEESGLSGKWLTSLVLTPRNRSALGGMSPRLGLDKLILVFGMLLVGLLISTVIFICEIIFHKI